MSNTALELRNLESRREEESSLGIQWGSFVNIAFSMAYIELKKGFKLSDREKATIYRNVLSQYNIKTMGMPLDVIARRVNVPRIFGMVGPTLQQKCDLLLENKIIKDVLINATDRLNDDIIVIINDGAFNSETQNDRFYLHAIALNGGEKLIPFMMDVNGFTEFLILDATGGSE